MHVKVKLKMLMLFKNLAFVLIFTQTSCYTVIGPKLFSQTIPPSSRGWSNLVPYPFRAYQPSIPIHYYGRYFEDPYFSPNVQNTDYYFSQDPYLSTFDDSDYYSNILYYIPSSRRTSYYDQTIMDPTDDIQDYEDDTSDNKDISKSQREWWLEKNVTPNEDIDVSQIKQIDSFNRKNTKTSKKQKMNPQDMRKLSPNNRYDGIDGFGRKKDKEQIFGNYKSSLRKEQPPWMYGVPIRSDYDDSEVRELKSLLKEPDLDFEDTKVAQWASGNMKRSVQTVMNPENKENSSFKDKFVSALKHVNVVGPFPMYNEGGQEDIKETMMAENKWAVDYATQQPSVLDTIKTLLALEDKMKLVRQERKYHKMLKRKEHKNLEERGHSDQQYKNSSSFVTTIMKKFPCSEPKTLPVETTTKLNIIRTQQKRSTSKEQQLKSLYTDGESLVNQLTALRHRKS